MFDPFTHNQLTRIRYAETLADAAAARASRWQAARPPQRLARRLVLTLVAAAPAVLLIVWLLGAG